MGELSLDLKPTPTPPPPPSSPPTTTNFTSPSINLFLKEVSMLSNVSEKLSKVDGYIKCLEEEMKKIDAFKRELPLCMILLNDAIGALKCETMQWNLEKSVQGNENDLLRDKKSWMSSVQLWTTSNEKQKPSLPEVVAKENERSVSSTDNIFPRNGGGAFVPFKGFHGFLTRKEDKEKEFLVESPGLSLLTPPGNIKKTSTTTTTTTSCLVNSKSCIASRVITSSSTIENSQPSLQTSLQSQALRKQRRCWSPDLHRRFLNALQQLGGSQVATPKQIRELMKVDGLTNDEVKSHLQKYRLHTRRYPANANAPAPENQKLVLFGGLWVPADQCGTSKASTSESESPQGPLQMAGTSGGTSTTGGDSMDDEEDGKSESYNWKGQF